VPRWICCHRPDRAIYHRGMAKWWIWCLAMVLGMAGLARADEEAAPTVLAGRVTDVLGRPIAKARVYVLIDKARIQAVTDKDGRYSVAVSSGAHSVVIAVDRVHTYRQVLATAGQTTALDVEVEIDGSGGEIIRIVDREPPVPAVPPKPAVDQRISLPYSGEAKERDAWARAWLLLDVDETGRVSRLKLLKRPGFDLDQIAIDEAFKLRFEPARDAAGKPMRTYVVWTMEWPSWGWLVRGNGIASGKPNDHDQLRLQIRNDRGQTANAGNLAVNSQGVEIESRPGDTDRDTLGNYRGHLVGRPWAQPPIIPQLKSLSTVPCAGSGPLNLDSLNRAYRDCSPPPSPSAAAVLPWITRENARTALAELARTAPPPRVRVRRSRVPELTATVITAGLLTATVVSWDRFFTYADRVVEDGRRQMLDRLVHDQQRREVWQTRAKYTTGSLVIVAGVTAFLWGRGQSYESFSVQPTRDGGTVSYGGRF
jgi:hypothetical protein